MERGPGGVPDHAVALYSRVLRFVSSLSLSHSDTHRKSVTWAIGRGGALSFSSCPLLPASRHGFILSRATSGWVPAL